MAALFSVYTAQRRGKGERNPRTPPSLTVTERTTPGDSWWLMRMSLSNRVHGQLPKAPTKQGKQRTGSLYGPLLVRERTHLVLVVRVLRGCDCDSYPRAVRSSLPYSCSKSVLRSPAGVGIPPVQQEFLFPLHDSILLSHFYLREHTTSHIPTYVDIHLQYWKQSEARTQRIIYAKNCHLREKRTFSYRYYNYYIYIYRNTLPIYHGRGGFCSTVGAIPVRSPVREQRQCGLEFSTQRMS